MGDNSIIDQGRQLTVIKGDNSLVDQGRQLYVIKGDNFIYDQDRQLTVIKGDKAIINQWKQLTVSVLAVPSCTFDKISNCCFTVGTCKQYDCKSSQNLQQ